jgi:drug/metabolite transporter (DMT)-like permease
LSAYIGFSLIAQLGLVTTTLLGFLSMVSTLFIGFFFLGDRPEKRNVFLAVTVALLVAIGTFLKVA